MGCYVLIGQTPVPCGLEEWSAWMRDPSRRRVKLTRIGPFIVSTVFLGLDYNFFGGPPLLFETRTFCSDFGDFGGMNDADGHTSTWMQAEQQHAAAIMYLRAAFCHTGEQPVEVEETR